MNSLKKDSLLKDSFILENPILQTLDTIKVILFEKSSENNNEVQFEGTDKPNIYQDSLGTLFKYPNYSVVILKQNEFAGDIIKVYNDVNVYADSAVIYLANPIYNGAEMGEWFKGLKDKYLFLDLGTGPDRGLDVVDLSTRKSILVCSYSTPISIDTNFVITFYTDSEEEATPKNHPQFKELIEGGVTPTIEEECTFNIKTRELLRTGRKRGGVMN